ncbi:gamma-aminobutyric acid type B receptor subunit 2 isoform X2 [Plodia interpunctella]|uniref:gamma-aminobutyric acid type B receptor subunit 2 isoform X2 n=1 Tax=Plodia interpunctella TaxID=58824 RepID=UPI002367961A|nr:gamma-aminobutyric acid type B receptor subunit 2 isoform X2 [Plodia interpunctella]
MRRSHPIQPLNFPSSFWETLKISLKLLILVYLLSLPTNSQMTFKSFNGSYHEKFSISDFTDTIKEKINDDVKYITVADNNYQILLNRFRRKSNSSKHNQDTHQNKSFDFIENDTSKSIHEKIHQESNNSDNTRIYREIERKAKTEHSNSMAKLRVDDATRNKIFYDFSKTINRNSNSEILYEDSDMNNLTTEINFDILAYLDETKKTFINESVEYPFNLTSDIPSIYKLYTPRSTSVNDLSKTTSKRVVSILGLFELSVGRSPRVDGASELAAARLAVRHVNERDLLQGYTLQLITNDTECDAGVGVDRFFHALYTERASRVVALLGTACSDVTESIAKIVPYWNIVQVSFGSTTPALSDRSQFPLFSRTVAPDSSHHLARIAFIRRFGWDTVTAFSQNEEVYSLAVNELVTQLEAANITCAASITFAETDFKQQLLQLKAFRLGMFGAEYAWLVAGAPPRVRGNPPCTRAQLAKALESLVTVTTYRGLGDVTSYSGLTNEMFHREMKTAGVAVSTYAPQTYDAVWAIALALSKAESIWRSEDVTEDNSTLHKGGWEMGLQYFDYDRKDMAEVILYQLGNLSFLGVSGPISFNGADRIGTSAFYQIQGGRPKLVALYTNGRELPCPECSRAQWAGGVPAARRVLVSRLVSVWPPARLAVAVMAATGVALSLAFLAFNLHYSKRRSIKLSSPRLNNMTLTGCVLVYTAVALLGVDSATLPSHVPFSVMCTGRVYILSAGFSLAFGSMFAKTYRVHRIFISNRSGVCKTKLLQDTPLISLVCALQFIDGLIITLWAVVDPMERQLRNLTAEISDTDRSVVYQPQVEVCKSQNTTVWLSALYAYNGLLLVVGVYMAWETRHVKISALNDSKYIGISVYSVVITSASVVVIGTLLADRPTLAYISITTLILITTTSTLCLVFLPKIMALRSKTEDDPVIQSLGLRMECKTRRFVTDETQELRFRIEIQNKVYKKEVIALDKEIGRLEKLLAEPLESNSSSSLSIALHRRTELNTVEEEGRRSDSSHRTTSVSGGLPMLLLSVLPPVIPRASWPSAEACRPRNSVSFSSQPKLSYRKSQPAIDLYNLCLTRPENHGLLNRIKSFFGSRPSSRKASTMSIADPSGSSIANALKLHVGMIAGLVPGIRKRSMVVSCNTLNVPNPELRLRRESYAKSGPIIRVIDDEPSCSNYEPDRRVSTGGNKYVAEPETKVNFVLPTPHKRARSHQNSCEKIKGSPRFPHRLTPSTTSLTTIDTRRKTSADSVFCISGKSLDEYRRHSHQNVCSQGKNALESRWKSTEDARPGPSTRH